MSTSYDVQTITDLAARLEPMQDDLQTLLTLWPTKDDEQLKQLQSQQEAMLTFIIGMQKANEQAERNTDPMSGLEILTDAYRSWQQAKSEEDKWVWLFKKEFDDLETAHDLLNKKLIELISVQIKKIFNQNISIGHMATELRHQVVDKALDGELAKRATTAVTEFARPKAEELANNRGELGSLWKTIRDATENASSDWVPLHEMAVEGYAKSGQLSKKRAATLIGVTLLGIFTILSSIFIFYLQPTETFCLVDTIPCQPQTREALAAAAVAAAVSDSAIAQTQAAQIIEDTQADIAATQTREAEIELTADIVALAEASAATTTASAIAATAQVNTTLTQEAIYATQTHAATLVSATVEARATVVAATAIADTITRQCSQSNGYAFEIIETYPLMPREGTVYVSNPTPSPNDSPLASAKWTIRNTGICPWGLEAFTVGLFDLSSGNNLSDGLLALRKGGLRVGPDTGQVQVAPEEEAELLIYFRGPGTVQKEFVLILGTVGGDLTLSDLPHFEVNATNWTIPQTPTPSPTPTFTPSPPPTSPPPTSPPPTSPPPTSQPPTSQPPTSQPPPTVDPAG